MISPPFFQMKKLPNAPVFAALLLVVLVAGCTSPSRVVINPSTLTGKVMVGYQGWFNAEGDGAARGYNHWTRGNVMPAPGNIRVDMWPDLNGFPAA
eukprot:gene53095-64861_t